MKKTLLLSALLCITANVQAAISFAGSALATSFSTNYVANTNYVGVLLNLDAGADWSALADVAPGTQFTIGSQFTINSTSFTVFGRNNATGLRSVPGNVSNFSFSGGMSGNDQFAILILPSSAQANSLSGGTALSLWRSADWLLPAVDTSGSTFNFGSSGVAFTTIANTTVPTSGITSGAFTGGATFTSVPEPSTYALLSLAGLALGGYAIRRRRRA